MTSSTIASPPEAPAASDISGTTLLDPALLDLLIDEHLEFHLPRLERLWDYYRNPLEEVSARGESGRWYTLGQEQGLPPRIVGADCPRPNVGGTRREIVIENDIAWRVHSLVDFMFGKPVMIQSCAPDAQRAALIESFLRQVLDLNGGIGFFQDLALLGSVYGYVDVLLRVDVGETSGDSDVSDISGGDPLDHAGRFVLETIEAPRAVPLLSPDDYRVLEAYVLNYRQVLNEVETDGLVSRIRKRVLGSTEPTVRRVCVELTEVWTDQAVVKYRGSGSDRVLVAAAVNPLGRIPVVHFQNLAQPFFYEGLSEVEPLIPLQDELNTRMSDRANRVTFQSFKMYLGKGIEGFIERPVGPGQMWATDNENATIEEFGGDAASPSEDNHIAEIRDAMDKTSSVTAIAAGLLKNKIGNLTSENALRIPLMGLLGKTEKKRVTYGAGIQRICELILHAADVLGILPNSPQERRVRLCWPSPLPDDITQRLQDAQLKLQIGIPRKQVLDELGYGECAEAM